MRHQRRNNAFPKLLPKATKALMGFDYDGYFGFIGVSEDGALLLIPGTIERPREWDIPESSCELALRLRTQLLQLAADGVDLGCVDIDIDSAGQFVLETGRRPAHYMTREALFEQVVTLPQGIQLTLRVFSEKCSVSAIAGSLAEARQYFKANRDELSADGYKGPYRSRIVVRDTLVGALELSKLNVEALSLDGWRDAVVLAYSRVNTLEQMRNDLFAWRRRVTDQDGVYREILTLLGSARGDLDAIRLMLEKEHLLVQ